MTWIYIIIGLVVFIGLVYWIKSKKKDGGGPEMPISSETPSETPPSTGLDESSKSSESPSDETSESSPSESSSSEEDRPM